MLYSPGEVSKASNVSRKMVKSSQEVFKKLKNRVENCLKVLKLRPLPLRQVTVPQLQLRPTAHFVRSVCVTCEISYFPPKDFANFWSEVRYG